MPEPSGIPASRPPAGLAGLDPEWSRLVNVDGVTWHLLERSAEGTPKLTVVAVHGNPTWSYLWRRLLAQAPPTWRVIAVDQIGMGYSERPAGMRRLADRITDLSELTDALGVSGPVVTVAHDWGGPVSLGWALGHRDQVIGSVLANTAVHQPAGAAAPGLIRLARWSPMRHFFTTRTPVFARGTTALSGARGRSLPASVRAGFSAPYRAADRRVAIGDFVADIPLEEDHPTAQTLDSIADQLRKFDVPVLLAWGADDPVFSDRYLRDLSDRMPHADVHRYEKAGHLVTEDAPTAIDDIVAWIENLVASPRPGETRDNEVFSREAADALRIPRRDDTVAIADLGTTRSAARQVTWSRLAARVDDIAMGLRGIGVAPGDRVALLIPPGADLVATVYACWAIEAAVVVADRGLGVGGMRRALRGAGPDHIIAIAPGLGITRGIDCPGARILAGKASASARRALGVDASLTEVANDGARLRAGGDVVPPVATDADAELLIAFTSGSTGPAKGVRYTRSRLNALVAAIGSAYSIDPGEDALVAAFAPWVVLGPALGIASAIPDMDVTDPRTLTMWTFTDAADAVSGTIAWTSPTGVRALVDTAGDTRRRPESLRLLMIAGAPTPLATLEAVGEALPGTRIATPYGMTEALPLTEVDLPELRAAGLGNGVLVGHPLEGVEVRIAALDSRGIPADHADSVSDVTGEVVIRAPWMKAGYDRRWGIEHRTAREGWHRTGDVGHLDAQGRLWIEGRLSHVISTATGPVTPVAAEEAAAQAAGTALAGCVGVGPRGRQVVVIVLPDGSSSLSVADVDTTIMVRAAVKERCGVDVAAVLTMSELPVDVRHRAKIDRTALAAAASRLLAGTAGRRFEGGFDG